MLFQDVLLNRRISEMLSFINNIIGMIFFLLALSIGCVTVIILAPIFVLFLIVNKVFRIGFFE